MKTTKREPSNMASIGKQGAGKTTSDFKDMYQNILKSEMKYVFLDFHGEGNYVLDVLDGKLLNVENITYDEIGYWFSKPKASLTIIDMKTFVSDFDRNEKTLRLLSLHFDGVVIFEGAFFSREGFESIIRSSCKMASFVIQYTSLRTFL